MYNIYKCRLDILNSLRFWLVELFPGSLSYYHWFIANDKLLSGFCLLIIPNLLGLTLRWEYSEIWQVAVLIIQHLNKRISACAPWYQVCQLRLTVWTIAMPYAYPYYQPALELFVLITFVGPFHRGTLYWVKDYVPAPRPQSLVVHRQKAAAGVVRAVTGRGPPWQDSQVKVGKGGSVCWGFCFVLLFWMLYDVLDFWKKKQNRVAESSMCLWKCLIVFTAYCIMCIYEKNVKNVCIYIIIYVYIIHST